MWRREPVGCDSCASARGSSVFTRVLSTIWFLLITQKGESQTCPNYCSGHGECSNSDLICVCEDGWDYFTDCSARTCANASGWTSKAHLPQTAHMGHMECSNRGHCDRGVGECICDEPYAGVACERMRCPNDCSDNGLCVSMYRAGIDYGLDTTSGYSPGGDGVGFYYQNWDAQKVQMCFCDWGRTGADCGLRYCPAGDDPVTTGQRYRVINMTIGSGAADIHDPGSNYINGSLTVGFNGHHFTMSANASKVSATDCENLWKSLDNVDDVDCSRLGEMDLIGKNRNVTYQITFKSFSSQPQDNNVFTRHDGNPLLGNFTCDISNAFVHHSTTPWTSTSTPTCIFGDVVNTSIIGALGTRMPISYFPSCVLSAFALTCVHRISPFRQMITIYPPPPIMICSLPPHSSWSCSAK